MGEWDIFKKVFWTTWISTFTIEFAVMFSKMSHGVLGVLKTDLAISKICLTELGHNSSICEDLSNYSDIQVIVQKRVNMLEMYGDMMCQVPTIIYALLAGSLSDKYGRKPLMILPIIGQILEGTALIVNKVWFRELPAEALWLANIYDVLGGGAIWYLAVYGFAADITTPEERASRMARFDGFEQTAYVVGNALSPILYHTLGYEGAFSAKIILAVVSLGIVLKAVKTGTSHVVNETSDPEEKSLTEKLKSLFNFLIGMFKTVLRKRGGWLRLCIFLQIGAYAMYFIVFSSGRLWYLYLRKQFGWKQDEFIILKVVRKSLGISILLLLVPCLKMLKISDTSMLIIFNILHALGFLISSFSGTSLPLLYCGVVLITFHYPKYALARSLLSQSVGQHEVGRIFSSIAFISALVPLFSHLLYGNIYDATVSTFPGAFMIFTSCLIAISAVLMVINKLLFHPTNQKKEEVQLEQTDKLLKIEADN